MELTTFKNFINLQEKFVNIIDEKNEKEKYKEDVWNILQKSYAPIGGIKGSGFANSSDMINIPFWKIAKSNGKIVAVALYKEKGGRKLVATGTDGSEEGKIKIVDIIKNDLKRSYGEKSKGALGLLLKLFPENVIKEFLFKPNEVSKILKEKVIPFKKYNGELPEDVKTSLMKYPFLKDYGYFREIGGNLEFKIMVGISGIKIR